MDLREQVGVRRHCGADGEGGHEGRQEKGPVLRAQSEDPPDTDADRLLLPFQWNSTLSRNMSDAKLFDYGTLSTGWSIWSDSSVWLTLILAVPPSDRF